MIARRVPGLNEAERVSLERIIRFAGWLPTDSKRFRELHDAVRDLQAAADSGIALRDALYAVELAEQQLPGSSIMTILRRSTGELHDQFEAAGMYASNRPSHD